MHDLVKNILKARNFNTVFSCLWLDWFFTFSLRTQTINIDCGVHSETVDEVYGAAAGGFSHHWREVQEADSAKTGSKDSSHDSHQCSGGPIRSLWTWSKAQPHRIKTHRHAENRRKRKLRETGRSWDHPEKALPWRRGVHRRRAGGFDSKPELDDASKHHVVQEPEHQHDYQVTDAQ